MSDNAPPIEKTESTDKYQIRHRFVGLLFSLAIAEVARRIVLLLPILEIHPTSNFIVPLVHLVLCALVIVTSWVGWSHSIAVGGRADVPNVFSWPFFGLLIDVTLVVFYFILATLAETPDTSTKVIPPFSAQGECVIVSIVFFIYMLYDILTDLILSRKANPATPPTLRLRDLVYAYWYQFWIHGSASVICVILTLLVTVVSWRAGSAGAVVAADGALIGLVFLFRALKPFERKAAAWLAPRVQQRGLNLALLFGEPPSSEIRRGEYTRLVFCAFVVFASLVVCSLLASPPSTPTEMIAKAEHPVWVWFGLPFVSGVSFLLSLRFITWVRRWALDRGFVDRPEAHKAHETPKPLGGGIAITASIVIPILIGAGVIAALHGRSVPTIFPRSVAIHLDGMYARLPTILAVVGCALVLHVVGLFDDRRPMNWRSKLIIQFVVAIVTAWPIGIRIFEALPVPLSIALTVLWVVVITNAFNFLDNMDGLSAGVAAIAATLFAITALRAGQIFVPLLALTLVGALLGFLIFNFAPASIFMGDAGSLVIGYLMSVIPILTTFYDPDQRLTPLGVLVPVIVLAVPLYDVLSVVTLRLRLGQSPFRGDQRHFSHRLVRNGMTPRKAVLTIYLATLATGLAALVLPRVDWTSAVLLLSQCAAVVGMIALLEGRKRDDANSGQMNQD